MLNQPFSVRNRVFAITSEALSLEWIMLKFNDVGTTTDLPTATPITHLSLLLFALQTALTTTVCILEYSSWPELNVTERRALGELYVPYLIFGKPSF